MVGIDPKSAFQAHWHASLDPQNDETLTWLINKVKNFVFYIPNTLIATCFNPRGEAGEAARHSIGVIRDFGSHNAIIKRITTPDNVSLEADVYYQKNATSATPTVILFNPAGAIYSFYWTKLRDDLIDKGCNVVLFNYRGLGTTWSPDDLVTDGESVYQYVTEELGIQKEKVHIYGLSLGGAIGAQVRALHPGEGKYVGDRTFSSIYSFLSENLTVEFFGETVRKVISFVSGIFIAYPVYLLGWELDGVEAMSKFHGEKLFTYHPNDSLVPYRASLASHFSDSTLELNGKASHFDWIEEHQNAEGGPASGSIAEFLAR